MANVENSLVRTFALYPKHVTLTPVTVDIGKYLKTDPDLLTRSGRPICMKLKSVST